jgi:hypothetical protein
MTTALTLITDSLSDIGVAGEGQPLSAADAQVSLRRLNDLLDAWAIESLYAWATTEYTGTATSPATIGPAGDVVTPYVPTQLEGGFIRENGVDYGFDLVSYQEYSKIAMKSQGGSLPQVGYYDAAGTLLLYPVPGDAELHVSVLERLSEFSTLATNYTFRPGVRRALRLSLNEELTEVFKTPPLSAMAVKLAQAARRILKRSNHVVPQLETYSRDINHDSGMSGGAGTSYTGVDGGTP